MPKPEKEHFRDFVLCEVTHLNAGHYETASKGAMFDADIIRNALESRLAFGKKAIDEQTKPGELIMLETPEEITYEQATLGGERSRHGRILWDLIQGQEKNLYHTLAKYAKNHRRKVASLEPKGHRPGTQMFSLVNLRNTDILTGNPNQNKLAKAMDTFTKVTRLLYNIKTINQNKPALVIAANAHALYIEDQMKPKKVLWHIPPSEELKQEHLVAIKRRIEEHRQEIRERDRQPRARKRSSHKGPR